MDGITRPLPNPFIVLATENPIEYEGTFPLPEAQLDRFLIRLSLGYPGRDNEIDVLERQRQMHPLDSLAQSVSVDELIEAQEAVKAVHVERLILEYIVSLVEASRNHDDVYLGASPRGSLALDNTSRAWAALQGRDYVIPDDVKDMAEPSLAHRLIMSPAARMKNIDSRLVVRELLTSTAVPGARAASPGMLGGGGVLRGRRSES